MQLFIAEYCGRWGCTWQENIINLILATFPISLSTVLFIILLPIVVLILLIEKIAELLGFKTNNNKIEKLIFSKNILFSPLTSKTAKFIWKRRNKISLKNQQQILKVAARLSQPETRKLINKTATNLAQQCTQKSNGIGNRDNTNVQSELSMEINKKTEPQVKSDSTNKEKIEIDNVAKEKGKPRKIIDKAASELAKNYLEQELNNLKNTVNTSDSKTRKAITQTAKAIALAYIEETSETEAADKTKEKSDKNLEY